ncbi:hypothetical protein [Stenotrophomonas sp.]|uniref:hypothetical protein n=1 Tax=Stenotrophomonas sp. TaxID=69392 RepID=UPI002FC916D7
MQRLLACRHLTAARRALTRVLPVPALISDVREVVYLSWWVEVRHAPPPPPGHRLFVHDGRTPYTILTYRHGHFGPALAGPLRGLLPSPLQSNWRWYVVRDDAADGATAPRVLFDRNVIDSAVHAVGARLWSDAMQPHLAARFEHAVGADGGHTLIVPGQGSAPALQAQVRPAAGLAAAWAAGAFADARQAMTFLACQEAAFAVAADGRLALTHIDLPIALAEVQPLQLAAAVACPHLAAMGVDLADAFCFRVPQVPFRVVSERLV